MIISNSIELNTPQFRVLTENQCQELYTAALECLERIGVQIHTPAARELLIANNAMLDGEIVYIPKELVEQAVESTPGEFSIWGPGLAHEIKITQNRVHFGPGPTCTYFIDPNSGACRKAQRGDAGMVARVCDALPNIDYVMGLSLFDDVLPVLAPVYEFAEELENTSKPIIAWANTLDTFMDIYQMAVVVSGSEKSLRDQPILAYFTTYESPLRLANAPMTNMMRAAELGVPVVCLGGPTVGLESPFTGASALVLHLACALASLTVVQTHIPGAPMMIGGLPSMMDLRTARPAYGSPEASLHTAAAVDLARYLGLPFMGTAGASDAKLVDAQAGAEAAVQVLASVLSGPSLVHDVGFLDCADIGSLGYLVLVDEIIGMAARFMRGIQVNRETIMMDLIAKVGPGGTFINQPESVSLCRREAWVPSILDRSSYHVWRGTGSPKTEDIIGVKINKILNTHQPVPLPYGVETKLAEILVAAEAREQSLLR